MNPSVLRDFHIRIREKAYTVPMRNALDVKNTLGEFVSHEQHKDVICIENIA